LLLFVFVEVLFDVEVFTLVLFEVLTLVLLLVLVFTFVLLLVLVFVLVLLLVLLLVLVLVVTVVLIVVNPLSSQYCVPDVQSPVWSELTANDIVNKPNINNGPKNPLFKSPLDTLSPI
jgi:hypothetical protein